MGESAGEWDETRQQFYFYNFIKDQPDLNWHNPDMVDAIFERAEFWLDKGVDGFRIDAPNYFYHDLKLRDNLPRPYGFTLFNEPFVLFKDKNNKRTYFLLPSLEEENNDVTISPFKIVEKQGLIWFWRDKVRSSCLDSNQAE